MTDKLKHRIEYEKDGPLQVVRIHRQFFGRQAVAQPILVEVEYEEHETLFGAVGVTDDEGCPGRSCRAVFPPDPKMPDFVDPKLVFTPDPTLFGTDADRIAAGKLPFVELKFGEWNILNLSEL